MSRLIYPEDIMKRLKSSAKFLNNNRKSLKQVRVPNRIVSISKSDNRPIVWGKEVKAVLGQRKNTMVFIRLRPEPQRMKSVDLLRGPYSKCCSDRKTFSGLKGQKLGILAE
jgi:hypothetical protein